MIPGTLSTSSYPVSDTDVKKKPRLKQLFEEFNPKDRRTNIICTIDQGTNCHNCTVSILGRMIDAGMNVARINFDSRNLEDHQATLQNLREAVQMRPDRRCTVLVDVKGEEIEVEGACDFNGHLSLRKGQ